MFKTKNPAMEIIGDPTATEDQWIPACVAVEHEYNLRSHHQRAGLIGWLGAVIDSSITAISGGFLIALSAASIIGSFSCICLFNLPIAIPFGFSFTYGLWTEHYNGGKAWTTAYLVGLICAMAAFSFWTYPYLTGPMVLYTLTSGFGALLGLQLGKKFFQRLKRVIKPWNIIGIGQLSMFTYTLLTFSGQSTISLFPVFVSISFMIGILASLGAKGKSLSTTMALAIVSIAMPILMTLIVLLGSVVTRTAFTTGTLGICFSLVTLIVLTLAGAATGHWFLRCVASPYGVGKLKFDDPSMQMEDEQNNDDNAPFLSAKVSTVT